MDGQGSYEFSADQKGTIDRVGMAFKATGIFVMIYGIITAVGAVDAFAAKEWLHGARALAEGFVLLATSRYIRQGGAALDAAAKGSGNGVPLLMTGLEAVRAAMRVFGIAMLVMLVVQLLYVGAYFAARHFGLTLPTA